MPFLNLSHSLAIFGITTLVVLVACEMPQQAFAGESKVASPRVIRTQPTQQPATEARPLPPIENFITIVVPEKEKAAGEIYNPDCAKPTDHDEADLCEQKRMSKAAEDAASWAGIQTKLSSLGFLAVIISLVFTAWASLVARRAAKTAESSVAIATNTAKMQLRAYIILHFGEVLDFKVGEKIKAHVFLKNFGQTPAYDQTNWVAAQIVPFDPKLLIDETLGAADVGVESKGPVGPSGEIHLVLELDDPLTQNQLNEISSGNLAIHVFGAVTYRDVFGQTRRSTFNLYFGGDDPVNFQGRLTHAHHGNEAD